MTLKKSFKKFGKYIKAHRKGFNTASLIINICFLFILFFEFFLPESIILRNIQLTLGVFFVAELLLRIISHKFKRSYIFSFLTFLDALIIVAIFVRFFYWDNTFLHLFTSLKILRSYRVLDDLSEVNQFIAGQKNLIISAINLSIFTFFMSSVVFVAQVDVNEDITTFLDSLYFTLSTLTTTGFGDITVIWQSGKTLAILIMIFGTGLFLHLVTVMFRPIKKHVPCKHCWLQRHDKDASHCKHCGNIMYIEHDDAIVE